MKNTAERIRVFLGDGPEVVRKVIECSVVRRTEMLVDFCHMVEDKWKYHKYPRWLIPHNTDYVGRAIFLDHRCFVGGDVWDLWTQPEQVGNPGRGIVWCPYARDAHSTVPWPQTDVMVIDCTKAKGFWGFNPLKAAHYLRQDEDSGVSFERGLWLPARPIPISHWLGDDEITNVCRFITIPPWLNPKHPLALKWQLELSIAVAMGFVTGDMLAADAKKQQLHKDYLRYVPKSKNKKAAEIA